MRSFTFDLALKSELNFDFDVTMSTVGAAPYTGEYEITPRIYEPVVLLTKNRMMTNNVTVNKIPQYEVSNVAGGNTLIMGDEYYG